MAQKQTIDISFAQGLDLKTDPFRVPIGKFLSLTNTVFNIQGQLTKRNGYPALPALPDSSSQFVTTFKGGLTAMGTSLLALSSGSGQWVNRGSLTPISLSVLSLIRSNTNQSQADSAVSSNGLVCTVYTDNVPSSSGVNVAQYKYAVADVGTGQNVIAPTLLVTGGSTLGTARVFLLGNYFVLVYTHLVSSTHHLTYIAVNSSDPSVVTAARDIASAYVPAASLAWDGIVANNQLFLAFNTNTGSQAVKVTYITSTLGNPVTPRTYAGKTSTLMTLAADTTTPSSPIIYVSFYDAGGTVGYTAAVDKNLNAVLAPVQIIASGTLANLTSIAVAGVLTVFEEVSNAYSFNNLIPSNYIQTVTVTQAGVVGSPTVLVRSIGLASKAFRVNGVNYFLGVYSSAYQPTYFLISGAGKVISRLAYGNSGTYYTTGLPQVTVTDSVAQVTYLLKDFIAGANKTQGASVAGIYSQTGVNLVSFDMSPSQVTTSEIGNNLNISGGFVAGYDGYSTVEQGFFVWPDDVTLANPTHPTPTGNIASGTNTILVLSSIANIVPGMNISGTDIPAETVVVSVSGTTVVMSADAVGTHSSETITFTGNVTDQAYYYQFTYEWADNQGNMFRSAPSVPVTVTTSSNGNIVTIAVPTLRLTYKISNPVKIVGYRWSTAQPVYFEFTSILTPTLNNPAVDSLTLIDYQTDSAILGNNILYTTGGELENIAPPASDLITLFNNRVFLVSSEDRNLIWFSKQVIESTPVEMSDLLTIFIAPTTGSEGSTGPITALAPMDDKLIVFKSDALGYFNGNGPDNTGSQNQYSEFSLINSVVGCTNQNSIVLTPQGLMFESHNRGGIWTLSRDLQTPFTGSSVQGLTDGATVLSAVNPPGTTQVRFTLDSGITLMYDYYYGEWTTFSGVPAISATIYQGRHTFINSLGRVFQESLDQYLDDTSPVLMSFTTSWINLAGLQGYQRAFYFYLLGTYITPHRLSLQIAYDYNPAPTQASLIQPDNYSPPYGSGYAYGAVIPYGGNSRLEKWKVGLTQMRCQSFQIFLQEVYDPSFGVPAGEGLTLSGLNLVVALKKGYSPTQANSQVGGT